MIQINSCFCLAAFALMGSTTITMLFVNTNHMNRFKESLTADQAAAYTSIVKERAYIYIFATLMGAIAGYVFRETKCKAVSAALFVQMMVYLIWPKSDYMMNHVETKEQGKLWVKKYVHMSRLGNVGLIAGIVLYMLVSKKN